MIWEARAHSIVQGTTHQELEGEVVSPFGGFAGVVHLGVIPVDLRVYGSEILHVGVRRADLR